MTQITRSYPATPEKAQIVRSNLATMGVRKARVRRFGGSLRLVLTSREDREAARDALVLSDAITAGGRPFTDPESDSAWNGPTEIFVRFSTP